MACPRSLGQRIERQLDVSEAEGYRQSSVATPCSRQMTGTIPFNRPTFVGTEHARISEALARIQISGDGHFGRLCERELENITEAKRALLVTSCTHALEMSALLLNVRPGDEVIVPSFTFVSTANAFVLRGATPVFVDIRPDTLNLDERLLDRHITAKTRAIVPVHYAGVACEMDEICEVAQRRGVAVVEDNAHGLFGSYRGRPLGSFGVFATQSFHETKNIICGEGGALLVNDPDYVERAEIIREKGTNRSRFFRGHVDKYTWVDIGSSYVISDLLAAVLSSQLEARQQIQARRMALWQRYDAALADWCALHGVTRPTVPPHCIQPYHMYYILLPSLAARQRLIAHAKAREVHPVFHYLPLHTSPMGERFGARVGDCPVTEQTSDRLLRLPFFTGMTDEEQAKVIDTVLQFRC
jgi:dTDP-4-amino-4,6-dideoxygalactose transaminase